MTPKDAYCPTYRVLCKFFVHGACLKGEHCEFSHDWKDTSNNICTFYQKGACSYGSGCRYEHVRVSRIHSPTSALPSNSQQTPFSDSIPASRSSQTMHSNLTSITDVVTILPTVDTSSKTRAAAWGQISSHLAITDFDSVESLGLISSDEPICPFAAAGNCPYGEGCKHIHGDFCLTCGKHCLHPSRPEEREEHRLICEKKQMYVEALKHSQDIECSVCLERVLSKATPSERKFGLLSECDHPFCIACIRNWRGSSPSSGMDINTALRACPICRKLSYFVIPSVIWYSSQAEKIEIVESYKGKLRSIDCKYFDFGNGTCPFGTSCFYKHAFRDGTLEQTVLRYLGSADGDTIIAKDIRLSDFLGRLHIR